MRNWKAIFAIIEKHRGDVCPIAGAEHDMVYLNLDPSDVTEDSEDGKLLDGYGCHVQDDCWCHFV